MFDKGLLQGVQPVSVGQPFDRADLPSVGPNSQITAGVHRLSIQENGAGAAFSPVTSYLGAGQAQVIPQNLNQCPSIFHFQSMGFPIDLEIDLGPRGDQRGSLGGLKQAERNLQRWNCAAYGNSRARLSDE
jgi:hypothetical protein